MARGLARRLAQCLAQCLAQGLAWLLQSQRRMRTSIGTLATLATLVTVVTVGLAACGEDGASTVEPPGEPETTKTKVLEAGARILQQAGPSAKLDIYLVGFHPMVDDPHDQLIAHHYCKQVNEDFAQCALWDSNDDDANLNGIEYIISEQLFESLPPEEQQYWHPHNYEILAGQLVAPGLPPAAELALMKGKMNSYGKTWHLWNTGMEADSLPLGRPRLAWSINADGELDPGLLEQRDRMLDMSTEKIRAERQSLAPLAKPQRGEDRLKDAFSQRSQLQQSERQQSERQQSELQQSERQQSERQQSKLQQ